MNMGFLVHSGLNKMAVAEVHAHWLLVLALLVGHSQGEQTAGHWYIATLTGQSEGITCIVDLKTLPDSIFNSRFLYNTLNS